jgi:putative transposase
VESRFARRPANRKFVTSPLLRLHAGRGSTVRRWCGKFGQAYADILCRRRPRPGDKWLPDEVLIKINGVRKYLWRAVDQDGTVLDILVRNRRDKAAARRFFRRLKA